LAAPLRNKLVSFLKILFSAALLYFIFTKLNFHEIIEVLGRADTVYLSLAVLLFIISKILSAFRLNLYFHVLGVPLTQQSNLRLYLLGMFYNLFLPGGIGGDAYKGFVIRKHFETSTREVISALVLDRLSGLLLLFIYACLIALVGEHPALLPFRVYFVAGIVGSLFMTWYVSKRIFFATHPVFWNSLGYSALVQLAQLACAFFILLSLSVHQMQWTYLFVFLVSSIVAVLPLTLGGIGSRELVFFYGAVWLGLQEYTSVAVSMAFFLITALVSLGGLGFHFKKPELEVREDG
jgi:uncharacterized membrane protein YbhN (UPF0104 family)